MAPQIQASRVLQFAAFEIDLRTGVLRKSGARIKLQEQPFQILAMLLERPGDVLTREELREKLWSADTFVDFDNGLNTAIKKLRDTLGDSADSPRFIETLPKRGYRFIYPVNGARTPAEEQARRITWWRARWVVGSLGIVAVLGILLTANVAGLRERVLGVRNVGPIDSVAVLPCKNLTGDSEQEFLSDGLTDVLTTHLAQVKSLTVPSVTSSMYFKGEHKKLSEIARELRVQAVVEPSVQRSGQRLLFNFQLIHTATDRHLWAKSYEVDPKNVQALLPAVTREILEAMNVKVTLEEKFRLSSSRETTPEAYEAYMRGRYHLRKGTETDRFKAAELFNKAIEIDPRFAPAYAGLAALLAHGGAYLVGAEVSDRALARKWADKAMELEPTLAETHAALGWLDSSDWNWKGAEEHYKRAIELNASDATAHTWYSQFLASMRRFEEAFAQSQIAMRLGPADPDTITHAAFSYLAAGRIDQAIAYWQSVLELDPNYWGAHTFLGRAYVKKGMYKEGIAALERTIELRGREGIALGTLANAYAKAGRRDEALKLLRELEERARKRGTPGGYGLVVAYAGLGDGEKVFALLEKSFERHTGIIFLLKSEPLFEPFDSDPRYRDLLIRIGLPTESLPPQVTPVAKSTQTQGKKENKKQ
ncbi:MAG TPA: tetratricopeptide repeat protein [Candidatus Polarisedimenticolia bacterium]|nr:tetratricopeptide repeat protein [Candidatus Polarisedimenticolia bacterium]